MTVGRPTEDSAVPELRSIVTVGGGRGRRYRIDGLLGRGGFGVVYKARMEGAEGFVKDVAIKILAAASPTADTLARFRDEARILGHIQDRAIVGVDPPLLLDGRWAVIMDFVEGANCQQLLRQHGRMPATVAFEIVQEIARAIDTLWNFRSDGARPLRLLHRDLKPGNIQITSAGTVKLMDFGVARAEFANREAVTEDHIGGTVAYVSPERLRGVEGPAGEIWSLGVVLEELVRGRDRAMDAAVEEAPEIPSRPEDGAAAAIALARRMRSELPADRPTAAVVEDECRRLARAGNGPTLRAWARTHVSPGLEPADEWVGKTFSEVNTWSSPPAGRRPTRPSAWWSVVGAAVVAAVMVAMVSWLAPGRVSSTEREEPTQVAEPGSAPVEVAVAPEESGSIEIAPTPTRAPPPRRPSASTPAPTVVPPPMGHVVVEGVSSLQLLGTAGAFPAGEVPPGTYAVQAAFDRDHLEPAGEVTVGPGQTVTLVCRADFKRCTSR